MLSKKAVNEKVVVKVNNIDTSGFILKNKYDTDKSELGKKISDADKKITVTNKFVKKADYNAKISKIQNKIPSISGLAKNYALTAVENKIPNVSNLTKKEQVMTQKLVKSKRKSLIIIMINILLLQNLIRLIHLLMSLNRKINSNKAKHVLAEKELKKLQTFDSSYFQGKSHFEEVGAQNCLVFQPINIYFKRITGAGNG